MTLYLLQTAAAPAGPGAGTAGGRGQAAVEGGGHRAQPPVLGQGEDYRVSHKTVSTFFLLCCVSKIYICTQVAELAETVVRSPNKLLILVRKNVQLCLWRLYGHRALQ